VGEVDVLLHGSPSENVDSILRHALLVERRQSGAFFWLTPTLAHARMFMRSADRLIAFVVLVNHAGGQNGAFTGAVTITNPSHALPLFVINVDPAVSPAADDA